MKKILSGILLVAMNFSVFGYSDTDVERANYLANNNIIRDKSSDVSQYRLDDKISRQEVIAIAMKLSGETAPEDYTCRGYFSDAKFAKKHPDAWVCAQVELAADKGVVSRENKKFRPKANITKAEALAMVMRGAGVLVTQDVKIGHTDLPVTASYSSKVPQWQIDMIESAQANQVIDVYTNNAPETDFAPNALATRAQVFEFAANILQNFGGASENRLRDNNNGTTTYTSAKHDFSMVVPTRGVQIVSENIPDSTGTGIKAVFGYSVLFNG